MTDRVVDRAYLTEVQYASDANLAARQAIYRFQNPPRRIAPWVLELAGLSGRESVVELGCGNGLYLAELARRRHRGVVVGVDLSAGMLAAVRKRSSTPLLQCDAQRLPFADASFDRVLALHMLYHVPDRDLALAEMRRVVKPGGMALVSTNSVRHLEELNALIDRAGGERPFARAAARFSSESGAAELGRHFASVDHHDARSELVVTEARAVVDYAASGWALALASDGRRERALREVERQVEAVIASEGAFRVRTDVRCFVVR